MTTRTAGSGQVAGPQFPFTEAMSLSVDGVDQVKVDSLWARLSEGGSAGQCGWLKDKCGLAWQITPRARVKQAMMTRSKSDIVRLQHAYSHQ